MLRFSSALAALTVAKAMSQAELDNECYDFWNKLEEAGVGEFDALNVNIGTALNEGSTTAIGTGSAINYGRNHLVVATDPNGNNAHRNDNPTAPGDGETRIDADVGAAVNLRGATLTAVDTGVAINQQGAVSNTDVFEGPINDLHIPDFSNFNGGLGQGGNFGNGNMGVIHRAGDFGAIGGYRRRMMENICGPPPAKGGTPVTCASTGDPHIVDFHGRRFDHMAFGEFIFYNSWEPFSHHPVTNLKIHVRNGAFHGNPRVAANHGVAIGGKMACGNKYEIFKSHKGYSKMKISRRNGQHTWTTGRDSIYQALSQEVCPQVKIENNVAHFIFEEDENEDRTTLRVQIVSYGLNLGLDVLGRTVRTETDRGVCTKNAGWDMQLECSHSLFSSYPDTCATLSRGGERGGPPQKCPKDIFQRATQLCSKCPETVNPKGCVYDVCAVGDINHITEVLSACDIGRRLPKRITVGVGAAINMQGGTVIAAGTGNGINYGVNNVRVVRHG